MPKTKERYRTIEGWARAVLIEEGAIRECEDHGWAKDRADPHARERAVGSAQDDPPPGVTPDVAVATLKSVLDSIGDVCPECPPD
jgi:hypothetical protein